MNIRTIKFVRETVGSLTNLVKGLNINQKAVKHHTDNLKILQAKLDGYNKQYSNQEFIKTLSPPEKQNIIDNANKFYRVHQETQKELDYLNMSRYSPFVERAIESLDRSYVMFDYIYRYVVGEIGDIIVPKFTCIKPKDFWKGEYKQQITNLYAEIEAQVHDFQVEILFNEMENQKIIYMLPSSLPSDKQANNILILLTNALLAFAEAMIWIENEEGRLKTEGIPEIKKIPIPEETPLKVPEGPSDKNDKKE